MQMTTKPTPTPWTISGISGDNHIMATDIDGKRHTVAIVTGWPGDELEANKLFIQSAVNLFAAHERVAEALQETYSGHIRVMHGHRPCACKFWDETRSSIAALNQLKKEQTNHTKEP